MDGHRQHTGFVADTDGHSQSTAGSPIAAGYWQHSSEIDLGYTTNGWLESNALETVAVEEDQGWWTRRRC